MASPLPPTLRVEFAFTAEDYLAGQACQRAHPSSAQRRRTGDLPIVRILLPVFFALIIGFVWISMGWKEALEQFLVLGSICVTMIFLLPRGFGLIFAWYVSRKIARLHREGKTQTRVAITPEGISQGNDRRQRTFTWDEVESVVRDGDRVFFYHGPAIFLGVPQRAFPTVAEFEEFVRTAGRYHSDAAGHG
jgi:hypothetical protein